MNLRNKLHFWLTLNQYVEMIVSGKSPLLLSDAIVNSLEYVKAFGETEQRNLPSDYVENQFVNITEGSYLLTDIVPTYNCRIEMDFQTTTISSSTFLLGGRTEAYGGIFFANTSSNVFLVDSFGNSSSARYTSTVSPQNNTRYKFVYDNQVCTLTSNGTTLFTRTFTGTLANGAELCINGRNTSGTIDGGQTSIYLYSFKVWNPQGELLIDLIPATDLNTSDVGFYDKVSKQLLTATTGTFIAGPEAIPTPNKPMDIISNNGVLKVNRLDLNNCDTGHYYDASGNYLGSSVARLSNKIAVKAGDVIAITTTTIGTGTLNIRYNQFNTNDIWVLQTVYAQSPSTTHTEIITIQQDGFFNFSGNHTSTTGNYVDWDTVVMINKSNPIYADGTVETIEDIIGNTATAEMLLKLGNYQNEQEIISGTVTKKVVIKILDGTEDWITTSTTNLYRLVTNVEVALPSTCICSHYLGISTTTSGSNMPDLSVRYGYVGYANSLYIKDTTVGSLTGLKQYFANQYAAGTPVIVIYPLATPISESVTGQTLQTVNGDNIVKITQASLSELELEAKYKQKA